MKKKYVFAIITFSFLLAGCDKKETNPNIVIILADDMGWGDVGFHGGKIKTPSIDGLSREGIILNRYYTAALCSPTRAGLLTGRYPDRFGIRHTTIPPYSEFGMDTTEVFLPEVLAGAGYENRTIIGKWHLGHSKLCYTPLKRGFTHFYGHYNGAIDYFTLEREGEKDWHDDYETSDDEGYSTDLITDEAVNCIKEYKGKSPFFIYVAYNAPHGPFQAKESDLLEYGFDPDKPRFGDFSPGDIGYQGRGNTIKQTYAAMVTCMDRGIGKILQTIKDQGIEDNTLVLFHSDNGAIRGGRAGSNGELKGYKFHEWEGGIRSPAIIKWPAKLEGKRTIEQVMGYVDIFPTICEIVGVESKDSKPLDGMSMYSVLKGETDIIERDLYLGHGAMINNHWKLIKANSGNPTMKINQDMLFEIPPDYYEKNNVKNENLQIYEQLLKKIAPYDSIVSDKILLRNEGKEGFKAPKEWMIKH